MTLLRFHHLHKKFDGMVVLDDVSATLRAGEVVLLQGSNGVGKTTLLNILGGAVAADSGEIITDTDSSAVDAALFRYPEALWRRTFSSPARRPETVARQGISRIWQDVRLFDSLSITDNLAAADQHHPGESVLNNLLRPRVVQRHEQQLQQRVRATLAGLGLGAHADSPAGAISLGQAKRTATARGQITGARVLLLDEPLAGLDDEGRTMLVADLARRVREESLALVIVEHASNRAALLPLITTVWTLAKGRLHVSVPSTSASASASVARTNSHALAGELIDELCTLQAPRYRREIALPGDALLQVLGYCGTDGVPALSLSGARLCRGPQHAVAGSDRGTLDFALYDGETAILQAPNGWGKTSLLEALAGLLPLKSGSLRVANGSDVLDVTRLSVHARRQAGLALLQSRDHDFPGLTPHEALLLAGIHTVPEPLRALSAWRIANLSGGERQLLALVSVLLPPDSRIRLLDEPLTGLDANAQSSVLQNHWRTDGVNLIALPGTG